MASSINSVPQGALTGSIATNYQDLSVSTSVVSLTVPKAASQCLVYVDGGNIRARWDSGNPTASDGMYYGAGQYFALTSASDMQNFKAIEDSTSTSAATLRVTYS